MVFIETSVFTRHVIEALTDEQYGLLQGFLVAQPDAGDLIRGSAVFASCAGHCQVEVNAAEFE
jgi:hypothetical protein